jgi:hypothetical protein
LSYKINLLTMKENRPYEISSTFVFRTPLFPFNLLLNVLENLNRSNSEIDTLLKHKIFAEALFLGSPELYEQIQKWVDGKEFSSKDRNRFFQSIYKYLSRMSSRSTPFGLFAGCGLGKSGDTIEVFLVNSSQHERHTRLDMSFLCNLTQVLEKNDDIKNNLLFFLNTTLYKSGEKLRYIEYRYKKDFRTHHLIEIKNSEYLEMILIEAKRGITINQMVQLLVEKNISLEQCRDYVNKLINNQILISELDPSVTGDELLSKIINKLSKINNIDKIRNTLNSVNNKLCAIDLKIGNSPKEYYNIASEINNLGVDYNIKFLFQTDLNIKSYKASLNNSTLNSVKEALVLFNKLTLKQTDTKITQFIAAFTKRYENREIPLLKALDTETGIGYLQLNRSSEGDISPLVADLAIPLKDNGSKKIEWDKVQDFILGKLLEGKEKNSYEVEITEDELDPFEVDWNDLPATFYCLAKLVEGPSEKYPAGRIAIEGAGGNSATQLLGRFCHGSTEIFNYVKEIAQFERNLHSDAILAEIAHLPESRVGNVVFRPIIHEYEIAFLASSGVDPEHTITCDDLYLSVKNNEIVIHSKRLNKRIIPCLSNAHNYSNGALPVYQFLCDIQSQNLRSSLVFKWGNLANSFTFKPRVIYKNLVISPASWLITKEEIIELHDISDKEKLIEKVKLWKESKGIPDKVLLDNGDNTLLVIFNSEMSVETFLSTVKRLNLFTLKEFLFKTENSVVRSEEGVFTNEFVFTFYKSVLKNGNNGS